MAKLIHILHIADLHASRRRSSDIKIVTSALFQALQHFMLVEHHTIDMICFTGDVADKGRPQDYKCSADLLFNPLLKLLHLTPQALFIVPGNHDVQRSAIKLDVAYDKEVLTKLNDRSALNSFLDDPKNRRRALKRLNSYGAFVKQYFYGQLNDQDPRYAVVRRITISGHDVQVACLNSSWRSIEPMKISSLWFCDLNTDKAP
jgi:DNA repair exonuclease SbcCD nuclease subunit